MPRSESALKPRTPEYKALHYQVNKRFVKSGVCEQCGESKRTCWSSVDHTYTLEREDWRELCYSCHRQADQPPHCKRGHEFSEHNTHVDGLGKKHCLVCQRAREMRKRRELGIQPFPHRKSGNPGPRQRNEIGQFVCAS